MKRIERFFFIVLLIEAVSLQEACCQSLVAISVRPDGVVAKQEDSQLALTPPMGWNTWNKFECNVSEKLIRGAADALVSTGMRDAGYEYVVIDDCWQVGRDQEGNILADPGRFPQRNQSVGRLHSFQGIEIRYLYLCRSADLCRTPWKPWVRIPRYAPVRQVGRRLCENRLVFLPGKTRRPRMHKPRLLCSETQSTSRDAPWC